MVVIVALALGIFGAQLAAQAQQQGKVYRIGVLTSAMPTTPEAAPRWGAFREELNKRGWVEGQNFVIERRWTEGRVERSPSLAAELVGLKVDLILATGDANVAAAKQATGTIPIVMMYVFDPVEVGLVTSLAHPGGNVTGVTYVAGPEIVGKHLELLKETIPNVLRVAVLSAPESPLYARYLGETRAVGQMLRIALQFHEVRDPNELKGTFSAMTKARATALLALPHPVSYASARRIADLAKESRLPAVFVFREAVEVGGLMAYAADARDMFRRAAIYVDKILKGSKPADLPVEQPTKFELVINLKTAKVLGLRFAQSILVRADEVIQ